MNVVTAVPSDANAKPISSAASTDSTPPHGVAINPRACMITTNPIEYRQPRMTAQITSPMAASSTPTGGWMTASDGFAYRSLQKKVDVDSYTAPFIAEVAIRAGATNIA